MPLDTPKSLPVPTPGGKSKGRVLDSPERLPGRGGGIVEAADAMTQERKRPAKVKKEKVPKPPPLIKALTQKKILDAQRRLLRKQKNREERVKAYVKQKAKLARVKKRRADKLGGS
ncbi:hypothetical protein diail_507 [Diaporthe ilicicola]|nr:hypothetical protein diail_507 [Diaporthe ilicicola]